MRPYHFLLAALVVLVAPLPGKADSVALTLRYQHPTAPESSQYHTLTRNEEWDPEETAVIVCDVWDLHHCLNAVRRVEEFGPRLNRVIAEARKQGMTIIHSPSDCMAFYEDHPARQRAIEAPAAANLPKEITSWCSKIPAEENGVYPIDQSDGGEDDDPAEHAEWAAKLKAMGRNPGTPWKRQAALIEIDAERDYISDKGNEVWNVLEAKGIKNVILTGVHTNMCVLGRPFGLRQMARNGKNVVLMRDMTDTMYNPQRWPYVSHFSGTDLIVSHIEKFVCATISSDQLIGGEEFRFKSDKRPHVAIIMAEQEYKTAETLPKFEGDYLGKWFRVSYVYEGYDRNHLMGLDVLNEADVALISVRRRTLQPDQLAIVRKFVADGKPVVGIRTASHAFSLRGKEPEEGLAAWPEFDAEVFGGNYTNHYGNKLKTTVAIAESGKEHAIVKNLPAEPFPSGGSLYKTAPLKENTTVLLTGSVEGQQPEPVAWTFTRDNGGRSFYTSLGHVDDFRRPEFIRLLVNGVCWAAELPIPTDLTIASDRESLSRHWNPIAVPSSWEAATAGALKDYEGEAWYRCAARLPQDWVAGDQPAIEIETVSKIDAWLNGTSLKQEGQRFSIDPNTLEADDANLLVVRIGKGKGDRGLQSAPRIVSGDQILPLEGTWQFRIGDDPGWASIPLPAKFGASADVVFQP